MNPKMLFALIISLLFTKALSMGTYVNLADKKIPEEIPIGSLITDLNEEISYTNRDYDAESVHFTFLDDIKTSTENLYFLLDPITGRLTSKRYLDRESMCLNKHCSNTCQPSGNCVINVKVLAIPSYNILNFNIEVQDINDNTPYFASEYLTERIPENALTGHKVPLELAYDPDSGLNSIQSYNLIEKNTPFLIEVSDDGLFLVVNDKLDRETVPGYNLTIEACDGGKPISCGQTRLNIILIDVNDNSPKFEKSNYVFEIPENELLSPVIGKIHAVDIDEGLNAKIKYSLMNNPSDYFLLDEDTGELKVKKWFDYEKENFFSLNIEAQDMGLGALQSYTSVEVHVKDLNDNIPEISVSFLNLFYRNLSSDQVNVFIPENIEANKFIAHVQIEDKDLIDMHKLEWNVYLNGVELRLPSVSGQEANFLGINKLNSESFTLNTGSKILDRELTPSLEVSIKTSDGLNIVYYNFTIVLLDENDNRPKMDKEIYELNINENNYIDQLIHKFEAQDPDIGQNGLVIYELESVDNSSKVDFVYIEPLTGYLRAAKIFDREQKSTYEFVIIARDNPKNFSLSQMTRVKCKLNIIDLNDNKPVITHNGRVYKNFTYRVDENLRLESEVLKLKCTDKDLVPDVKFFIKTHGEMLNSGEIINDIPFSITQNGVLINTKTLDREFQDSYEFEIICSDTRYNTSLNLRIILNDLNDNCPRNVYKQEEKLKYMFVDNYTDPIFKEFYTDDDSERNSELQFDLLDYRAIFLASVSELEETKPKVYELKIKFHNSSTMPKMGKYVLRVKIRDMGEQSCEIIEKFIVLIGDEKFKNESLLMDNLKKMDLVVLSESSIVSMVILVGFFVSLASFLILIILCCVCKRRGLKKKQKEIDCIKVRNYRLIEGTKTDVDTRLSLSETDQSGESVSTYAKDTTSPSPSASSCQQLAFYQLTSFQKQKVASDYSTSIGSTELSDSAGDLSQMQNVTKVKYIKYEEKYNVEEKQPCLVDIYHSENNYGHYLRSSIV